MHKKTFQLLLMLIFLVMLFLPGAIFTGAAKGLSLWFETVLPTLMPFFILSEIMIATGSFRLITDFSAPLLHKVLGISPCAGFAVVCGILCGCPSGVRCAVNLLERGYISLGEASYLLTFCNNFSPSFIVSYVFFQVLHMPDLAFISLLFCVIVPLSMSFLYRHLPCHRFPSAIIPESAPPLSASGPLIVSIEEAIINSSELLIKIGGFLMIFSVLLETLYIPLSSFPVIQGLCSSLVEVTNGIPMFSSLSLPLYIKYPAVIFFLSFGGFCGAAQTAAVVSQTEISVKTYTLEKLLTSFVTSLISFLYIQLRHNLSL